MAIWCHRFSCLQNEKAIFQRFSQYGRQGSYGNPWHLSSAFARLVNGPNRGLVSNRSIRSDAVAFGSVEDLSYDESDFSTRKTITPLDSSCSGDKITLESGLVIFRRIRILWICDRPLSPFWNSFIRLMNLRVNGSNLYIGASRRRGSRVRFRSNAQRTTEVIVRRSSESTDTRRKPFGERQPRLIISRGIGYRWIVRLMARRSFSGMKVFRFGRLKFLSAAEHIAGPFGT